MLVWDECGVPAPSISNAFIGKFLEQAADQVGIYLWANSEASAELRRGGLKLLATDPLGKWLTDTIRHVSPATEEDTERLVAHAEDLRSITHRVEGS